MATTPLWRFGPFCLDPASGCLWRDETLVPLRPKPFALLAYLVAHGGQVVTKERLFEAVWPETVVGEGVLKDYINQIRKTLGDTPHRPQYIATVHRRGYRFVAPVTALERSSADAAAQANSIVAAADTASARSISLRSPGLVVAREVELAQLEQWWAMAQQGHRQLGLVCGEAGIGKTTLIDAFVAQAAADQAIWVGYGQCIEHYGVGEAYLPLLEAFGRLGRTPDGARLVDVLQQYAPSWLVHLPALVSASEAERLQRRSGGETREHMLRELAEAVEVLTAACPLILILEDLHWSDTATLDWLSYVARRWEPARLLILGTYRPLDALDRGHPLRPMVSELRRHPQCQELRLDFWSPAGVAAYLNQRFAGKAYPRELAPLLHQRTQGNPLFLVTVVDDVVRRGVLREGATSVELEGGVEAVATGVPESLRHLIEQQLEQLDPGDQALLETASVAGMMFSAATVAAGMEAAMLEVEHRCASLARQQQFVQACGTAAWPDGTLAAQYGFRHAFYHEVFYERVPVARRAQRHRQIGLRLEAGYGPQAQEIAAELAMHFVQGREAQRAVQYLRLAGENALRRNAHQEAVGQFTAALELLATLHETPERAQQELEVQIALGPALMATKGYAAPEVEQTYARARALCQQVGETPHLVPTLWGLCLFYRTQGALPTARELGEQLYTLAQHAAAPAPRLEAHDALGSTLYFLGDYAAARAHLEQGIALTDPAAQRALALRHDVAPGVQCLAFAALTLWCLGYPAQAMRRSQEALALAQELAHSHSLAWTQNFAAWLHHRRREAPAVQAQAEALLTLATAQGFPLLVAYGTCWRGWALAAQGQGAAGLAQMHQGLTALLVMGQTLARPLCLALLAEAAGHSGQVEEGLRLLAEALAAVEVMGRGELLAETYRLQGALLLRQAVPDAAQAEASFHQALAIARRQQARSWELRAALSLSRLWQQQGKPDEARALLAPIYGWFTEGFETADLQEAKALLEELVG
jgi:DNA-binding winged helix-turn-helix (wHTH) protein/predicted ATPase